MKMYAFLCPKYGFMLLTQDYFQSASESLVGGFRGRQTQIRSLYQKIPSYQSNIAAAR